MLNRHTSCTIAIVWKRLACLLVCLYVCLSVCLSVCLPAFSPVCSSVRLSVCQSVTTVPALPSAPVGRLSVCPSVRLSVCPSVPLSVSYDCFDCIEFCPSVTTVSTVPSVPAAFLSVRPSVRSVPAVPSVRAGSISQAFASAARPVGSGSFGPVGISGRTAAASQLNLAPLLSAPPACLRQYCRQKLAVRLNRDPKFPFSDARLPCPVVTTLYEQS